MVSIPIWIWSRGLDVIIGTGKVGDVGVTVGGRHRERWIRET